MSGMQCGNKQAVNRAVIIVMGMVMAQGLTLAQTSEDKNQSGQQSSGKMNQNQHRMRPSLPLGKGAPPVAKTLKPLELSVTTDKKTYAVGTAIKITLAAKNTTLQTMNLNFSSGQRYDFTLREGVKPDGKIVWQWAKGKMFAQMMSAQKLEAGKSLTFIETLDPKTTAAEGGTLKAGTYTLTATLAVSGERPSATTQLVVK